MCLSLWQEVSGSDIVLDPRESFPMLAIGSAVNELFGAVALLDHLFKIYYDGLFHKIFKEIHERSFLLL